VATNKTFVEYIRHKLEKYEEGEVVTPDALMEQAHNKFKLLNEGGVWNAPSEQEEKILALQAKIKNLKKATKKHEGGKPSTKKTPMAQMEKPSWFFKEPKEDEMNKP
jgi:hypothetical protein